MLSHFYNIFLFFYKTYALFLFYSVYCLRFRYSLYCLLLINIFPSSLFYVLSFLLIVTQYMFQLTIFARIGLLSPIAHLHRHHHLSYFIHPFYYLSSFNHLHLSHHHIPLPHPHLQSPPHPYHHHHHPPKNHHHTPIL